MMKNYKRKVNLGCGFDKRRGYLNVDFHDFHKPDLVADVTKLDMLSNDYFEEILANDILEHIERTKTIYVLIEWNRILKKGGILKLRIPSIIDLVELIKKNQKNIPKTIELIQSCFGTQSYTGDFHHTSFTRQLITYQLSESGFKLLTLELKDEWMFDLTAEKIKSIDINEYKNNKIRVYQDKINELYRNILNREADEDGLHFYTQKVIDNSMTLETVETILRTSQEYRKNYK